MFGWLWFSWSGSCKGVKSELGYEWVALKMNQDEGALNL